MKRLTGFIEITEYGDIFGIIKCGVSLHSDHLNSKMFRHLPSIHWVQWGEQNIADVSKTIDFVKSQ